MRIQRARVPLLESLLIMPKTNLVYLSIPKGQIVYFAVREEILPEQKSSSISVGPAGGAEAFIAFHGVAHMDK